MRPLVDEAIVHTKIRIVRQGLQARGLCARRRARLLAEELHRSELTSAQQLAGSAAAFLALDCPSRGYQVKGALGASLRDRRSADPGPGNRSQGLGSYQEDGSKAVVADESQEDSLARLQLVTTALWLVSISVAFGVVSGAVSVITGLRDHSLGVFAIGLGVLADVTGSAVLIWRFRAERRQSVHSDMHETRAAVIVAGALAVVSACSSSTRPLRWLADLIPVCRA
jgi:hypothetical protein